MRFMEKLKKSKKTFNENDNYFPVVLTLLQKQLVIF